LADTLILSCEIETTIPENVFSIQQQQQPIIAQKCYGLAFSVTTILLAAIGILLCILCGAALCHSGVQQGT
jgi:hypothetical protein